MASFRRSSGETYPTPSRPAGGVFLAGGQGSGRLRRPAFGLDPGARPHAPEQKMMTPLLPWPQRGAAARQRRRAFAPPQMPGRRQAALTELGTLLSWATALRILK